MATPDRPGDGIGYHYDISHYRGARYTLLLGIEDRSDARLVCEIHTKNRNRKNSRLEVKTAEGTMVFFNGDKLLHKVSPIGEGQRRIMLTMQYVTDPRMSAWRRVLSNAKDVTAYFGADAFRPGAPG